MTTTADAPTSASPSSVRPAASSRIALPCAFATGWAVLFAAPHVLWATGPKTGLKTSLSARVVDHGGLWLQLGCAGIALFCLAGAATAFDAGVTRRLPRPLSIALLCFGAALLSARCLDIYVEFGRALTGLNPVPVAKQAEYLHLSRWFLFGYLPWFAVGAVAWTMLAVRVARARAR